MPMAGEGSRFKNVGINIPKPLIKANGVPLFVRSLYGITDVFNINDVKVTCIIQKKHNDEYNLSDSIKREVPNANVVVLNNPTSGSVETCMSALPYISDTDAILIADCDLEWHCYNYTSFIEMLLRTNYNTSIGGALLSFNSYDTRYSYALCDNDNSVIRTAEKSAISNNALVGAYYFNTVDDFCSSAEMLLKKNDLSDIKEYYTSLLYNFLISRGRKVQLFKTDRLYSFGTPEELYNYEHSINKD
jgi:dTDP-glucose pyrophosphorylase